ncbi:MAG: DUF342 domain-containing protein [Candidatus Neomarinimicrobiota bacterium]|nr:MAG: DUF342 domain-containing protein [Candidatus Neomarinimicrobiota bacterium]
MVEAKLSEDGRVGLLTIDAPPEQYPSLQEIQSALPLQQWKLPVDTSLLEKLVNSHQPAKDLIITRIDFGADYFVWYIDQPFALVPEPDEDGRIDFKRFHDFQEVQAGQKLLSVLPPEDIQDLGEQTRTILHYLSGRNTTVAEDGLTLYAAADGYVFIRQNQILVDNIYYVDGDVDYKTGNIKFDGVIIVEGDVRSGFRIDASDSIVVHGLVEAASLYSKSGDIQIQHGIMGKDRAKILAGGNIQCAFLQNAEMSARGDITIGRYAINSRIQAGGKIFVNTQEGLIRGGKVLAEEGLYAKTVGNDRGTETEIGLTGFVHGSLDTRRKSLVAEKEEHLRRLKSLEKQVEFFDLLQNRLQTLTDQKLQEKRQVNAEIQSLQQKITTIDRDLSALDSKGQSMYQKKSICIEGTIYSGVTISMGTVREYIGSPLSGVRFYRAGNEIAMETLETA